MAKRQGNRMPIGGDGRIDHGPVEQSIVSTAIAEIESRLNSIIGGGCAGMSLYEKLDAVGKLAEAGKDRSVVATCTSLSPHTRDFMASYLGEALKAYPSQVYLFLRAAIQKHGPDAVEEICTFMEESHPKMRNIINITKPKILAGGRIAAAGGHVDY